MFLSTLVSDAAAQHGHEFSPARPATPQRLSPIPRTIRPAPARQRPALTTLPKSAVKPSSAPAVAKVEKVMFAEEAQVKVVEEPRRSMSSSSEEEAPPTIEAVTETVLQAETKLPKKKRTPRTKTSYTFAHPPPKSPHISKFKSRQGGVMQLQQVVRGSRPKPAFEILPSGRYARRLGRQLTRLHKEKDRLGPDDVVVVKAQEYGALEDEDPAPEDVVGIICASCKSETHSTGNAQLCLEDGSTWEVIAHARGRYDFISKDQHGNSRVVRWVPRRVLARQGTSTSNQSSAASPTAPEELVYRFSTIDLRSRRHPIVANMTPKSLEINNTYYMPRANKAGTVEPTEQTSQTSQASDSPQDQDGNEQSERQPIEATPLLRSLVLLSGVYVALRNNWSPHFSFKTNVSGLNPNSRPSSRPCSIRSANASPAPSIKSPSINDAPSPQPQSTRRFTWNLHRRSTTVCATPTAASGALMSALNNGGWNDTSITSADVQSSSCATEASRSTTPESHLRRASLFRSVTDKWRQPSHSTISSVSTAVDSVTASVQSAGVSVQSAGISGATTPHSPIAGDLEGGEVLVGTRRAVTISAGFVQRASSLRHHLRAASRDSILRPSDALIKPSCEGNTNETSVPVETERKQRHSRTFSFARGRSKERKTRTLSISGNLSSPASTSQWWIDWGRNRSDVVSRPATAAPDASSSARPMIGPSDSVNRSQDEHSGANPEVRLEEQEKEAMQRPESRRRSISLRPWRRNTIRSERPKSLVLGVLDARGPPLNDLKIPSPTPGPVVMDQVAPKDESAAAAGAGFGGMVRRVTQRLRREERRIP